MIRHNKKPPIGTKVLIQHPGFEGTEMIIRGRRLPKVGWAGRRGHEWDRLDPKNEPKSEYEEYKRIMNKYAKDGIMYKI